MARAEDGWEKSGLMALFDQAVATFRLHWRREPFGTLLISGMVIFAVAAELTVSFGVAAAVLVFALAALFVPFETKRSGATAASSTRLIVMALAVVGSDFRDLESRRSTVAYVD